ncbi:MAG: hypothetical protein Q7U66_06560 [Methylobacter sp.]|nr:hypothetical protein [Methylobacter sp.]
MSSRTRQWRAILTKRETNGTKLRDAGKSVFQDISLTLKKLFFEKVKSAAIKIH